MSSLCSSNRKIRNSPYINRFLQPDTDISDQFNPQSWNRFSYVENNPVIKNDPTGHFSWSTVGSIAAKVAIGVASVAITASVCAATAGIGCIVAAAAVAGAASYGSQVVDNVQKNGKLNADAFTKNIDGKQIVVDMLIGGLSAGAGLAAGKYVGKAVQACTSAAAGLCRYAAAAGAGALTGGGVQIASNILDGDKSTRPFDKVLSSSWKGLNYGIIGYGASTGDEITLSKDSRLAPFGNRTGDPLGERPHYHERYYDGTGKVINGGGIGNHRPWE